MTPVLVWLLGLSAIGGAATAGARTLKKRNLSEAEKIQRLRSLQGRNAAKTEAQNILTSIEAGVRVPASGKEMLSLWLQAGGLGNGNMLDVSKMPQEAQDALAAYHAARQSTAEAINAQGGVRQDDDEEVGSDALAMIDSLDRRFGPYLRSRIIGLAGGNPNASFGQVTAAEENPAAINRAWINPGLGANPGMPSVKYLVPIWFRRQALQALADGVDPQGKVDSLGQDVVIDDATAELNSDFSAWVATFSPSQSEIAMLVQLKRIPDSPGFWDKVWGGIVSSFKQVLSLDFLVNVATMGFTDLKGGSNTASKAVTDQIKDKFGASEVMGWVGSGIDAQTGVTKLSPNPKLMTPEEKRIAAWLASQYVVVPDLFAPPSAPDQRPWVLRMDLALCGAWPILDVIQWMGGVEGFERSLIFAKAPNGEPVVGGSRDLYQKPGQLAMRAMVVARRALAGIEDRYTYGAASLLSMLVNRPDVAPSRTWLEWSANEWTKGVTFTEMWSYLVNPNNQASSERITLPRNGGSKTVNSQTITLSQGDAESQRSRGGPANLVGVEWQYGGANGPRIMLPGVGAGGVHSLYKSFVTNGRVNNPAIAASFAIGTREQPPVSAVPRTYTKWGIAGPVPITGATWVSNNAVDQMAAAPGGADIEAMSLTPQGRARLKSQGA